MHDQFEGTWKLNPGKSQFDANHRPLEGIMRWQIEPDSGYTLLAEGVNAEGEHCVEKPQKLLPDGRPYPVDGLSGLTSITTRPDPHTVRAEARRKDGSLAGEGSYVVAEDGMTMTATTAGFDSQLRRFEMRTVWDRV